MPSPATAHLRMVVHAGGTGKRQGVGVGVVGVGVRVRGFPDKLAYIPGRKKGDEEPAEAVVGMGGVRVRAAERVWMPAEKARVVLSPAEPARAQCPNVPASVVCHHT